MLRIATASLRRASAAGRATNALLLKPSTVSSHARCASTAAGSGRWHVLGAISTQAYTAVYTCR